MPYNTRLLARFLVKIVPKLFHIQAILRVEYTYAILIYDKRIFYIFHVIFAINQKNG